MSAPVVILTLAVADSVHILLALRTLMRRGLDKSAALVEALHQHLPGRPFRGRNGPGSGAGRQQPHTDYYDYGPAGPHSVP